MKNIIIFMIYGSSSLLTAMSTPSALYIENHYGALLLCRINNDAGRTIPSNGDSIKIGSVVPLGRFVRDGIDSLAISTTWFCMTSLDKYLEKFSDESDKNSDKDAVLMIKPSSFISGWDIEPLWRKKSSVVDTFSMMSRKGEAKTIERKLQLGTISAQEYLSEIEKSILFDESYAHKVKILREINYEEIRIKNKNYSTTYSKVCSFGYPSLEIILGGIKHNYQNYISYKHNHTHDNPGNKAPDEVRDFIKRMIDNQWNLYLEYQKNGWLD